MFKEPSAGISNLRSIETEKRLLQAAGEIFAECGYRAATVRQICKKAGANLAAVNYHFGDKEGLYMAVLRSVPSAQAKKYPPNLALAEARGDQKLFAYIRALLDRIFDQGRPGWHTKIMSREVIEPTRAFDALVEETARPIHTQLASIVRELLGSLATDECVHLCTLSIISQCVYYHNARAIIVRLYPEQKYGAADIDRLVTHITDFSLSALKKFSQRNNTNCNSGDKQNRLPAKHGSGATARKSRSREAALMSLNAKDQRGGGDR